MPDDGIEKTADTLIAESGNFSKAAKQLVDLMGSDSPPPGIIEVAYAVAAKSPKTVAGPLLERVKKARNSI